MHDTIHCAVLDESGGAFLLFVRSRGLMIDAIAMAQTVDDRLFHLAGLQFDKNRPETVTLRLAASDRSSFRIAIANVFDLIPDGFSKICTFLSLKASLPHPLRDHVPIECWEHLSEDTAFTAWQEMKSKHALSGESASSTTEPRESWPSEWLAPRITDHPYCVFVSSGRFLLALFVRQVDSQIASRHFAMVADPQNRVYLLVRLEIVGFVAKDVVLGVSMRDGREMKMKVPLSQLHQSDRENFDKYLSLECVKFAGLQKALSQPEELYQPIMTPNGGWV